MEGSKYGDRVVWNADKRAWYYYNINRWPIDDAESNLKNYFYLNLTKATSKDVYLMRDFNARTENAVENNITGRYGQEVVNDSC